MYLKRIPETLYNIYLLNVYPNYFRDITLKVLVPLTMEIYSGLENSPAISTKGSVKLKISEIFEF